MLPNLLFSILKSCRGIDEIKRDVKELVVVEDGISNNEISNLYQSVLNFTSNDLDYVSYFDDRFNHKLAISDITGRTIITRRFVDRVECLLSKYKIKEMQLLLECVEIILKDSHQDESTRP
jgi:hypothetical protein